MTTNYKSSRDVPLETIIGRLNELSDAVTRGRESLCREFTMHIPAECDRDADLIIGEAAIRLDRLQAENEALRARVAELEDFVADTAIACQRSLDPDWVPDGVQDALVPLSKRCCALLGDDPDEHESAWLLRKQAEAVDWVWHNYCRESALEDCKALYQEDMEGAVDALRQQAAELERQSEGGAEDA
ncbi:hypothetical protein [Marinobacter sp. OP 3.4]|uniref:hypothetical protein n=1 Tax=Marinobacter sp. OP 3.4 TaxID=3076501 RepID=UPI002E1C2B17